jgi:hypothetical protein
MIECGKILYSLTATDENMAHAHCVLNAKFYEQTIRICNTYCFFTAIIVAQKRLNISLYVHCMFDYKINIKGII